MSGSKKKKRKSTHKPIKHTLKAVGHFQGRIEWTSTGAIFRGDEYHGRVAAFSPKLTRWLQSNPELLSGYALFWPGFDGIHLRSIIETPHPSLELNTLTIEGLITWIGEGKIRLRVSNRIPLAQVVTGFLPDAKVGELWRVQAIWDTDRFGYWSVLDGEKIIPDQETKEEEAA